MLSMIRKQYLLISILMSLLFGLGSNTVFSNTIIESNIPDIGQRSAMTLSADTEEFLGAGLMQQLNASELITQDWVVNEYLTTLSQKLSLATQQLNYKLDYKLDIFGVNSKELNAFAFFGGHIAVHCGLILALQTESELAAVLSHETAHIAQRHLARIFTTNKKMMPLTYAEILGALVIGALGSPEAGSHLVTAALGSHVQRLINYTREHEQEADRIGIQILTKAGFDPNAFPLVFRVLSQSTRYNDKPPEYLLTHPVFESRIADCTNRAERIPYQQAPDSLFFHLVRARIEVDFETNTKQLVAKIEERLKDGRYQNKIALEYEYALALVRNKQFSQGIKQMQELKNSHPDLWIFELSLAECYFESGNMAESVSLLKQLYTVYPTQGSIALSYAEALLQTKQAKVSEQVLLKFKKKNPHNPTVLQMLVRTYSQLKRPTAVHQTQAEWHYSRGEYKEAFHQLDIALEHTPAESRTAQEIRIRKEEIEAIATLQKKVKM